MGSPGQRDLQKAVCRSVGLTGAALETAQQVAGQTSPNATKFLRPVDEIERIAFPECLWAWGLLTCGPVGLPPILGPRRPRPKGRPLRASSPAPSSHGMTVINAAMATL